MNHSKKARDPTSYQISSYFLDMFPDQESHGSKKLFSRHSFKGTFL